MTAGPALPVAMVPGPVKRWVLGARPRTLPAALVPVLVGTAAAHPLARAADSTVKGAGTTGSQAYSSLIRLHLEMALPAGAWWRALGALVVALAIQIGTNYANDYSDGIRGTDDARVGPVRLVATGLASPSAVKRGALTAFAVAGVVGFWLAAVTSWWVILVGAACLAAGWLYTGGPRPYGYAGLGELFVFVFFGLVATEGTYYVQTKRLGGGAIVLASVMVGLLATALLLANNVRDIDSDLVAGKRTLAARVGRRRAGWLYVATVGAPYAAVVVWGALALSGVVSGHRPPLMLLPLLAIPLAIPPIRVALGDASGRALLPVLAATGRLQLAFGFLLSVALWTWLR